MSHITQHFLGDTENSQFLFRFKTALAAGDIRRIESWCGKLDERLKTWLIVRLAQEKR